MASVKQRFFRGGIYHLYNRGNHREHVFRDNDDRKFFLSKVDEYCDRDRITVLAYCLMDNHFHLLLRQDGFAKVSAMMRSLMTSYVKRSNSKHGLVGRLFQGPYQSRWMNTDERLAFASRYIHRNPAKFADIRTYRWSSYRQYLGAAPGMADPGPVLALFESEGSYTMFVESGPTPEIGRRGAEYGQWGDRVGSTGGKFFLVQSSGRIAG